MSSLLENKRTIILSCITATVVIGSGVALLSMFHSNERIQLNTKPMPIVKLVPAPKKVEVPVKFISNSISAPDNLYLNKINAMSMQLHQLMLQNQISQQEVAIAKASADLNQSIEQSMPQVNKKNKTIIETPKLQMIFEKNGEYHADLSIGSSLLTVKKGSEFLMNDEIIKVVSIDPQSIAIKNANGKYDKKLSLLAQMETI